MIVYMLKDGLGNQFFEYAYAAKLQEQYPDEDIVFCTFLYRLPNFSLGGTRQCSLHHFRMSKNVRIVNGVAGLWYFLRFMLRLLLVYRGDFFRWFVRGQSIDRTEQYEADCRKGVYLTSKAFYIPPFVSSRRRLKFVFGNYESVEAFPKDEAAFRAALELKEIPREENREMTEKIRNTCAVCVHVRRGDYLNKGNEWLQVCDYEYYKRAIEYIKERVDSPVFYIFSNTHEDLEWIRENYAFDGELVYVDLNNSDYEEFGLMRACRHFVISNSTFSWWASYCSDYPDKIVIAPEKWVNRDVKADALFRKEFVKL